MRDYYLCNGLVHHNDLILGDYNYHNLEHTFFTGSND